MPKGGLHGAIVGRVEIEAAQAMRLTWAVVPVWVLLLAVLSISPRRTCCRTGLPSRKSSSATCLPPRLATST